MNRNKGPVFDAEPERILIFVPNWVGDAVMATPALRSLRRRFARAEVVLAMRPYVADVLAGTGLADEAVLCPLLAAGSRCWEKESHAAGVRELIGVLRARRFDLAVLLTNSFRSALVSCLAGVTRRVGYSREARGWLLTDRLAPQRRTSPFPRTARRSERRYEPVPALDYYNALARYVGCDDPGSRLELATRPEDEAAVERRLGPADGRPLVVLNPGANYGSAKCWPAEKFAALSDALVEKRGARVVASLGPSEGAIAARLARTARRPLEVIHDPPLGLGPLKALVRRCRLLVTNDTGPRHFAAAFSVPVVTVFGSSDPRWTDTRYAGERTVMLDLDCQPCMQRTCPLGHHRCMQDLSVERVLAAVDEFWTDRRAPAGRHVTSGAIRR